MRVAQRLRLVVAMALIMGAVMVSLEKSNDTSQLDFRLGAATHLDTSAGLSAHGGAQVTGRIHVETAEEEGEEEKEEEEEQEEQESEEEEEMDSKQEMHQPAAEEAVSQAVLAALRQKTRGKLAATTSVGYASTKRAKSSSESSVSTTKAHLLAPNAGALKRQHVQGGDSNGGTEKQSPGENQIQIATAEDYEDEGEKPHEVRPRTALQSPQQPAVIVHRTKGERLFDPEAYASIHGNCNKLNPNIFWECKHGMDWIRQHQPCTDHAFIARIDDAFVSDNTIHKDVPGTVFTDAYWFQWQAYVRPVPNGKPHAWSSNPTVHEHECLASILQAYPSALGHFPHEGFPRLLYLLQHTPQECQILVDAAMSSAQSQVFVNRYVALLSTDEQRRILSWEGHGHVYHAKRVYVANEGPYCLESNPHNGGMSTFFQPDVVSLVRDRFVRASQDRNCAVVIKRTGARRYIEHDDLVQALRANGLRVHEFDASGSLHDHIKIFASATFVIGPHGAGFSNLVFCHQKTTVVEIGWDSSEGSTGDMEMDNMYSRVAASLGLRYRLVIGVGSYSGTISAPPSRVIENVFQPGADHGRAGKPVMKVKMEEGGGGKEQEAEEEEEQQVTVENSKSQQVTVENSKSQQRQPPTHENSEQSFKSPLDDAHTDGASLQNSLYRDPPTFYAAMLRRKAIEERWSTHEWEAATGSKAYPGIEAACAPSGDKYGADVCNVATGGAYLCPPVLHLLREVLRQRVPSDGTFCVVGSGSMVLEAWALASRPNLRVVSFDLFNQEYKHRIAADIGHTFDSDSTRWDIIAGRFENLERDIPCSLIFYDTNIKGPINNQHWATIERHLVSSAPMMFVQSNNWDGYQSWCVPNGCAFRPLGATKVDEDRCYPDRSIIPDNMHPAVLSQGDAWNEPYTLGKWEHQSPSRQASSPPAAPRASVDLGEVIKDGFYLDPEGKHAENGCGALSHRCPYTYQSVMFNGRRTVRMDDYPFPSDMPIAEQQQKLKGVLDVFERYRVPYILGVSPLQLLLKGDMAQHIYFLNSVVKHGFLCMHGFDHRTTKDTDSVDTNQWERGGEFAQYTPAELEALWTQGHNILLKLNRYTTDHFIPPFNAITQAMVNVLLRHDVKFIHSFDVALKRRGADAVAHPDLGGNFGGWIEDYAVADRAVFVVSEWQKTYADAKDINTMRRSQITLHWIYDVKQGGIGQTYADLAVKLGYKSMS